VKPLVVADKLTKYFELGKDQRVHAVDGVSLTVNAREIVGLVGESGSGKSTFGKTVLGLHDKTSGTVTWKGELLPQRDVHLLDARAGDRPPASDPGSA
jgi:ABC-type oligopeptide transport system ATPase subunit